MDEFLSSALRALGRNQNIPQLRPQEFTLEGSPRRRRRTAEEAAWGVEPEDAQLRRRRALTVETPIARGSLTEDERPRRPGHLTEDELELDTTHEEQRARHAAVHAPLPSTSSSGSSLQRDLHDQAAVRRAILLSEILDRPRALRQYGRD